MTWADFVVRGTLVLAVGFAASYAFGRASAAVRHLIWTVAFVALLALPGALRWGPRISMAAWPAETRGVGGRNRSLTVAGRMGRCAGLANEPSLTGPKWLIAARPGFSLTFADYRLWRHDLWRAACVRAGWFGGRGRRLYAEALVDRLAADSRDRPQGARSRKLRRLQCP